MTPAFTTVPFVKASACGNDFLIIDGTNAPSDIAEFSRRICDRHQGVGADGVECLFPATNADVQARLFNADGSEAEISGNGTRCVAAHLCAERPREKVVVLTGAGAKTCVLKSHKDLEYEFETEMGVPVVGNEFPVELAVSEVRGIPVSMGNPHYVVFMNSFSAEWQPEAAEIGRHADFKSGVNVEFVVVRDQHNIDTRFFERGVGETQSSGTGSCAAAVATVASGRGVSPVKVYAPGGTQTVRWDKEVFLTGPARLICRGEFFA